MFVTGASIYGVVSSSFSYLITVGQSYALSVSGVAFQPAYCIVSLQNLTAASMSSSDLRETFKVNLSLMRRMKSSQVEYLLLNLVISLSSAHVLLV
jgi:hypothetical protein